MKSLKVLLGAVALALITSTAYAQTPAATVTSTQSLFTPAPSPSPVINKKVGTSSAWTKRIAVGSCSVNPGSIAAGGSTLMDCTVNGALTTDVVFVNAQPPNNSSSTPFVSDWCWYIQGAKVVSADTIEFRIANRDMYGVQAAIACDPPALTIDYILLRPNTQY